MEINDALVSLGTFGRWQFFNFISLGMIFKCIMCFQMTNIVFIGYKPSHHCTILNDSLIPLENDELSSCSIFNASNHPMLCENGWTFPNFTGSTIVTQWELVCQKGHMAHLSQTFLVLGVMAGALGFNYLADKFGRKKVILSCQLLLGIIGITTIFSPNIEFFIACRFLAGTLTSGLFNGYVLLCEMFPVRQRTFVGTIIQLFWAISTCILPLLCYVIQDWRYQQLTISLFSFLTLPLFCILRESVLWDIANGRIEDAEETLRRAAKMNGLTFNEPILKRTVAIITVEKQWTGIQKETHSSEEQEKLKGFDDEDGTKELNEASTKMFAVGNTEKQSFFDLLRNKTMLLYLVISSIMWMETSLVYYGLVLSSAAISGNRFTNAFFGGIAEIPSYILAYLSLKSFGRKKPILAFFSVSGVSLLICAYLDKKEPESAPLLILFFNCLGKFGITGANSSAMLLLTELFPTNLRARATGVTAFVGRIGCFLSILAAYVAEKYAWACMAFFGLTSILAGLLVLLLPETLNKPLPQTIQEACDLYMTKPMVKNANICSNGDERRLGNDENVADEADGANKNLNGA